MGWPAGLSPTLSYPTLGSLGFRQAHLIDLAPPSSPKLVKIITLTKTKNGDSSLEIFGILLVNLVAVSIINLTNGVFHTHMMQRLHVSQWLQERRGI